MNAIMKAITGSAILVTMLALLAGCSSNKSAVGAYLNLDTDLKIEFVAASDMNPDDQGTASPLFIRMFELKSTALIDKADFLDIYEQEAKVLGADLVKSHRLKYFEPGESRTEQFVLDSKTAYVGLFAEFSRFRDAEYKLVFPVVANNVFRNAVKVSISADKMTLED